MQHTIYNINDQINVLESQMESLTQKVVEKDTLLRKKITQGEKLGLKCILKQKKEFEKRLEEASNKQMYYAKIVGNLEIAYMSKDEAKFLKEYNSIMKDNNELYEAMHESIAINEQKKLQDEEILDYMCPDDVSLESELDREMEIFNTELQKEKDDQVEKNKIHEEAETDSQGVEGNKAENTNDALDRFLEKGRVNDKRVTIFNGQVVAGDNGENPEFRVEDEKDRKPNMYDLVYGELSDSKGAEVGDGDKRSKFANKVNSLID